MEIKSIQVLEGTMNEPFKKIVLGKKVFVTKMENSETIKKNLT